MTGFQEFEILSRWRKYQFYSVVLSSFITRITAQSYSLGWGWEVVKDRDSLKHVHKVIANAPLGLPYLLRTFFRLAQSIALSKGTTIRLAKGLKMPCSDLRSILGHLLTCVQTSSRKYQTSKRLLDAYQIFHGLNAYNKFEGGIYLRFRRKKNCFNYGIIIVFRIKVRELTSFEFVHLDAAR